MIRLSSLLILLTAMSLAAQEPAVPDFSKGMPDAALQKKERVGEREIFHLKTALGSKEFSNRLRRFLGAGWRKRSLSKGDMILAASKGRFSNAVVNLSVFGNAKLPGVTVRALHLKPKKEDAESIVEIEVIRPVSKPRASPR